MHNILYLQTDGVAMGGPLAMRGPSFIVAEIYTISSIETTAITTADTPPRIWERPVDDVYSPSYADETLNSSSSTSTIYIQKLNLPWKRKKIRPSPSSTHSYNEIKMALSHSKSTENPHILTSI